DLQKRLAEAPDIDAIIVDSTLPDPGLPDLLARLRSDANVGGLPLFITVSSINQDTLRRRRDEIELELLSMPRRRKAIREELDRIDAELGKGTGTGERDTQLRRDRARCLEDLKTLTPEHEDDLRLLRKRIDQDLLTAPPDRTENLRRMISGYRNV